MIRRLYVILTAALALLSCGGKGNDRVDDKTPEPYITGISTEYGGKAVAGKSGTLNGLNFSPIPDENKVIYGVGLDAVSLPVSESSEEHLVFTAPKLDAVSLKIRVSARGKESNMVTLEFITAPEEPAEEPWSDTPTLQLPGAVTKQIVPGVEWTTFHGTWEGQVRNINIVRTTLNEHNSLGIYYNYSTEGLMNLDEKCIYLDAVAGTNGPMACCHFVRVDGAIKRVPNEQDPWIVNCAITIDDGVPDIVKVTPQQECRLRRTAAGLGGEGPGLSGVEQGELPADEPSPHRHRLFQGPENRRTGSRGRPLDRQQHGKEGHRNAHLAAWETDARPGLLQGVEFRRRRRNGHVCLRPGRPGNRQPSLRQQRLGPSAGEPPRHRQCRLYQERPEEMTAFHKHCSIKSPSYD